MFWEKIIKEIEKKMAFPQQQKVWSRWIRLAYPQRHRIFCGMGLLLVSSAVNVTLPICLSMVIDEVKKVQPNDQSKIDDTKSKPTDFPTLGVGLGGEGMGSKNSWWIQSKVRNLLLGNNEKLGEKDDNVDVVKRMLFGFVALVGVSSAATFMRVLMFRSAGERVVNELRRSLYASFLRKDVSFFDKNMGGDLASRLTSDVLLVGNTLTRQLSDGMRSLSMISMSAVMMCSISPSLSGLVLLVVPAFMGISKYYGKRVTAWTKKTQNAVSRVNAVSQERLSQIRTIKAFGTEARELDRFSGLAKDIQDLGLKEAFATGTYYATTSMILQLSVVGIFWWSINLIAAGQLSIGELMSFLFYMAFVAGSSSGLMTYYSDSLKGIAASQKIFSLMDYKSHIECNLDVDVQQKTNLVKFQSNELDAIVFDNVSFAYPLRQDAQIYRNFSTVIPADKVTAIVGRSGSGKSTMVSLLLRFYDPDAGRIFLRTSSGGEEPRLIDIKDVDLRSWRNEIGSVSQEPALFAGTIRDNLRYGKADATDAEIETAASNANALSFIRSLPQGFDTFVGDRGTALSGGQKQRLALARCFLRNPRVLVLDEATSALDSESEALVQQALERLMKGRTVITIAHRLSTVQRADYILVVEEGQVQEHGTFASLMSKQNGIFRQLVHHQMVHTNPGNK